MKKKTIIITCCVVVAVILIAVIASHGKSSYQFVAVQSGSITQVVSVTGNVTPVTSLNLSFESGGTIAAVYKNAGDTVAAGDVLARLDTSGLDAQLAQAEAGVAAASATLANMEAGPTPQNLAVSQAAVAAAQQTLANTYAGIYNDLTAAYAKADDAVRNQISPMYSQAESSNPQLTFTVNDYQVVNDAQFERIQASNELNNWQTELNSITSSTPTSTLAQLLTSATSHLTIIGNMLATASTAIVDANSLTASTQVTYKTDVETAIGEIDDAATSISTDSQNIASQNIAVSQAEAQLSVTQAGSTSQAIAAQQASVQQAQANAQNIQVEISQASLVSPIDGVVTVQNANVGEIAQPGQTITSVISQNNLEVDADVPETDIGKVAIGNTVDMTFDAFPSQTFTGKVFYIDPAQTIISGVVDYLVKVSFDAPNANIKSGLTANLDINTQTDNNALILPQFAITQDASGSYVDILQNGQEVQVPVTLGIQDQNGNVEITSGVSNGEQVINVGLKPQ